MDEHEHTELYAILRELLRALTLLRELTHILESTARRLTELERKESEP